MHVIEVTERMGCAGQLREQVHCVVSQDGIAPPEPVDSVQLVKWIVPHCLHEIPYFGVVPEARNVYDLQYIQSSNS